MDHYFSENPKTAHNIKIIEFFVRDKVLKLTTDSGVFSKDRPDFGTRCLIDSLPELSGKVLDLGCGYGIIGLSIALLNKEAHVTMADINRRAVELAQYNAKQNGIRNVDVLLSDGFSDIEGIFSAIVSNPPIRAGKKVIYPMFEQSLDHLEAGGALYIVIQKKQGANSALEKLRSVFGNCETINKCSGYWILRSVKE
ncbi:MAG TPA: class I SAM-dependent methyltransferase [Candidatus Atribacteria bacterium]|nr:class I SAM-dependent methyltransferase [Candidatus Atribacteria bacterium]HPT79431.1 class I SAM-dependent methyltransferase [Candidatus Atribacteria bacterium]